ncbi:MAG: penicillin-binding protein 2 [Chthoniobacter sp.]|nr:penicillin-binding protein 2 [Chthoniobacter sp.]
MNRRTKSRAICACLGLVCGFTGFSIRLLHLQVTRHDYYSAQARSKQCEREILVARRGLIFDRTGQVLASNQPTKNLVVDGTLLTNSERLADLLVKHLGLDRTKVFQRITQTEQGKRNAPKPYIVVQKNVEVSVAEAIQAELRPAELSSAEIKKQEIRGVSFEDSARRSLPNDSFLSHVLGYVNSQNKGVDGIESGMEADLHGTDGYREIERTRKGTEMVRYRGQEVAARNGNNVSLTIDMGLQMIVEQELDATIKKYHPAGATVIMMEPKTGRILALANRPDYNPNKQKGVPEEFRLNLAVQAQYEPGSTFKIVTIAGVLNEGIVSLDDPVQCENGYWQWCDLRDHHAYATLSVNDVLVHSSNIGVAKLASNLGDDRFYEYIHRFGFGDQTGIALPGEIKGKVFPPYEWSKISITRIPMGHEVTATPIQIATAICVIANGGMLMTPQVIQSVADENGNIVKSYPPSPVRRVISTKTADHVRDALIEVASKKGTAKDAQVPGFVVAGKTGTAQKLVGGRYSNEKSVCSFVGFMPAEDPAFVLLVLIDEPKAPREKSVGGLVAGPVFSRIGERAAAYLGLKPTEPLASDAIIAKRGKTGGNVRTP